MTATDILPRLRSGGCGDPCRVMDARSGCACAEAADEIEAVRAQVETLTAELTAEREAHTREYQARVATEVKQSAAVSARASAEAAQAEARAEIERLRVALMLVHEHAKLMRHATRLSGPDEYANKPAFMRVYNRALYHEGRDLLKITKPALEQRT